MRWTNTIAFDSGLYRFTTETDDGVRLYVDGAAVDRQVAAAAGHQVQRRYPVEPGNHTVRMEYQERGDAAIAP